MSHKTLSMLIMLLCFFGFFTHNGVDARKKLPDFVKKCSRTANQDELKICMVENLQRFGPHWAGGIPELHIPPLDPFFIESFVVTTSSIQAVLTNVSVSGCANFSVTDPMLDAKDFFFKLTAHFPFIHVESNYDLIGHLIVSVTSKGTCWLNMTNVVAHFEAKGEERVRDGEIYVDLRDRSKNKIKLTFNDLPVIFFRNLFKGNEALTNATNVIINDNIIEVIHELLPVFDEMISTVIFDFIRNIFHTFPIDELFLP